MESKALGMARKEHCNIDQLGERWFFLPSTGGNDCPVEMCEQLETSETTIIAVLDRTTPKRSSGNGYKAGETLSLTCKRRAKHKCWSGWSKSIDAVRCTRHVVVGVAGQSLSALSSVFVILSLYLCSPGTSTLKTSKKKSAFWNVEVLVILKQSYSSRIREAQSSLARPGRWRQGCRCQRCSPIRCPHAPFTRVHWNELFWRIFPSSKIVEYILFSEYVSFASSPFRSPGSKASHHCHWSQGYVRFSLHEEAVGLLAAFAEDDEEGHSRLWTMCFNLGCLELDKLMESESSCTLQICRWSSRQLVAFREARLSLVLALIWNGKWQISDCQTCTSVQEGCAPEEPPYCVE